MSWRHLLPLAGFISVVAFLYLGLSLNPRLVPSPLVGKAAPEFSLPRLLRPADRLARTDLLGKVSLVNFWATWCVGCRDEHPLLVQIAREARVPIYGLNYKDQYRGALEWLERHGNPYAANGYDADGRVGIDFGVYGLPETYVIDAAGNIAHKHTGVLTPQVWEQQIVPLIERLEREQG